MEHFSFGAVESTPDVRDIHIDNVVMGNAPITSALVDYTGIVHNNQRANGICTAASKIDIGSKLFGVELSSLDLYKGGKLKYDGNLYEGSSDKTMLEQWRTEGVARKSLVPDDDTHKPYSVYIQGNIPPEAIADRANHKIAGYVKVSVDPQSIMKALSISTTGVIVMIRVGDNFYRPSWNKDDLQPLRAPSSITSAHSIKIISMEMVGDDYKCVFRNTWGDKDNPVYDGAPVWCDNGDIYFMWNTQAPYIVEAWTVTDVAPQTVFKHSFTTPISFGQTSSEVTSLQRVLKQYQDDRQLVTGFFGPMTAKNVLAFQMNHNVDPLDELNRLGGRYVGVKTISALNKVQGL